MNQVIENIEQRRSVRAYDRKPVDKKTIEAVIAAACRAPSGANSQPWRFVVAESPEFRKKLADLAVPRYKAWLAKMPQGFQEMRKDVDSKQNDPAYYGAPVIVFVIGKGMTSDFDCPMACQTMMLAARSFGLGSCWVYIGQLPLDDQGVRKSLALAEGEKVFGPILLGYPQGGFPEATQRNAPRVMWL